MSEAESTKQLVKVHNVVVVGDGTVGKTWLLHRFHGEEPFHDYIATVYDKSEFELHIDGEPHLVQLHDTAGQEAYDRLRRIVYPMATVFLLCFSVDNRDSLFSAKTKWVKELRDSCKNVPIVLCATKIDLRNGLHNCVTTTEAEAIRLRIGANALVECSAKVDVGVKSAIYEAVRASAMGKPEDKDTSGRWSCLCCIRRCRAKLQLT